MCSPNLGTRNRLRNIPFIIEATAIKSQTSRDLWMVVRSIRQPSSPVASVGRTGAAPLTAAPSPSSYNVCYQPRERAYGFGTVCLIFAQYSSNLNALFVGLFSLWHVLQNFSIAAASLNSCKPAAMAFGLSFIVAMVL